MNQIIELPYRRFHRRVIDRLVRIGYLPTSERHDLTAVTRAWDRFRTDVEQRMAGRNDPGPEG